MNSNNKIKEKMSPLYFTIHNNLKSYLNDNNIKYSINNSNNIELFTINDYKKLNSNIKIILNKVDNYTIDKIEFLWNKNLIIKLENNENLNIFCNLNFIDEIKQYIKNILNIK